MGEYLTTEGYWLKNPFKWVQGPKMDPRAKIPISLTKNHLKKIWIEANKVRNEYQRNLLLLLLAILYSTGLRRGELSRLKTGSWNKEDGTLKIDGNKTGIERILPLPDFINKSLEAYLPIRFNLLKKLKMEPVDELFINIRGNVLTGDRIGLLIHKIAKRARVPLSSIRAIASKYMIKCIRMTH